MELAIGRGASDLIKESATHCGLHSAMTTYASERGLAQLDKTHMRDAVRHELSPAISP